MNDPLMIEAASFRLFLTIWNQRMRQQTPQLHLTMANWLEARWQAGDKRLLLMAFRSAGKSTVTGLFAAWLLYRQPHLRILVLAADEALAKKMVRNVKRIIERHPLTGHLKPDRADQWASDRFTVKRMLELRDPSMLARGIAGNITGSRADLIICDDVEVPNTSDSADKREDLRERLAEMNYVMALDATQLYAGTPHTFYTIYADTPRVEIGEERAFLHGFKRLEIPVLNEKGESNWIERYSEEDIAQLKRATGPNKFASQMMLRPVNITESRLNPDLLGVYDRDLDYAKELGALYLNGHKLSHASAFWDPAFGSPKGDNSVVAVIYEDKKGKLYLHHLEYIKTLEEQGKDEAARQCKIVADIAHRLLLPTLAIETNGLGKFLPGILRRELSVLNAPCRVVEFVQKRNKEERILEAFDSVLASGRLNIHKDILKTPFLMEMREWRPDARFNGRDDALDAVASALSRLQSRQPPVYPRGRHRWTGGEAARKAKVDFEI